MSSNSMGADAWSVRGRGEAAVQAGGRADRSAPPLTRSRGADRLGRMWPAGPVRAEAGGWVPALPAVVVHGRAPRERPEDDEVLILPVRPARARLMDHERPEDDEVLVTGALR